MQVLGYGLTNSGNRLSPSGSSLVAANIRLAGLRPVSEFPGAAETFLAFWQQKARRPAVCGYRRALQTDQALPNYAPWAESSGYINARAQSFGPISVASCANCGKSTLDAGQFSQNHNPIFSRPTPTNWSNNSSLFAAVHESESGARSGSFPEPLRSSRSFQGAAFEGPRATKQRPSVRDGRARTSGRRRNAPDQRAGPRRVAATHLTRASPSGTRSRSGGAPLPRPALWRAA